MHRYEAVVLLKELGAENLIQPTLVLIEQRRPDNYQLCMKGNYDRFRLENFIKKFDLAFEEDTLGLLCIFTPE